MPFDAAKIHDEPCLQFKRSLNDMFSNDTQKRKNATKDWLAQVEDVAARSTPRGYSDAAVASSAVGQARVFLSRVYSKAPKDAPWAMGQIIPIDDSLPPGMDEFAFETSGAFAPDIDDGIVADDAQPQITVEVGRELVVQRARNIKHKFTLTMQDILRAQLTGYNKLEDTWMKTRDLHMQALNNILRRGSDKHGLYGVTSFPGIRRRISGINYYGDAAEDVYADLNSAIQEFDGSADHDPSPTLMVLDGKAYRHFRTADKVLANGSVKLVDDVEKSFELKVMRDRSLNTTASTKQAVLLTPDSRYIALHCPMYMYLSNPYPLEGGGFSWQVTTRTLGATVIDPDTIMVVEGAWD